MNELSFLFVVALLLATLLATIVCASTQRRAHAKICLGLGIAAATVGFLGAISGLILTAGAAVAQGLTESDRTRIWSNGLTEAAYILLLTIVFALPAVLVARRSLRKRH